VTTQPPRILLTTVFRPFCVQGPFDLPDNHVEHGTCHRQFTREQGVYTIHQQCSNLALHLIANNLEADTDVVEYPSLDELADLLRSAVEEGRPYDWVGVGTVASYVRKARRICELVAEVSPRTGTVVGGPGAMALGVLVEPFGDRVCTGDGVRFFRELLGQNAEAPLQHPVVPSVHVPNRILGVGANPVSYSLAVSLGCDRGCAFCSTSAQFGGRRVPLLQGADEILRAMEQVERDLLAQGRSVPAIYFVMFDENFLFDTKGAEAFRKLNRERLVRGDTAYLPFLFADAASVLRFTPVQLLEMGVDALWIGLEESRRLQFDKTHGVDFARLVDELQGHGIKVFLSFIAGLPEQSRASLEADVEYALELRASAYQYAIACPMPGTRQWMQLEQAGLLDVERPEKVNMAHYYLRHPELDEATLQELTTDFQGRDYGRHGPLALRFVRLRLAGYRRHRDSPNPALRARALGFRNDVLASLGAVAVGPVFGPTAVVRRLSWETLRQAREAISLPEAALDAARGRAPLSSLVHFLCFGLPGLGSVFRWAGVVNALRQDPRSRDRCRTPWGLLRHGSECVREIRVGRMPWEQPQVVVSQYGPAGVLPVRERRRDKLAGLARRGLGGLRRRFGRLAARVKAD